MITVAGIRQIQDFVQEYAETIAEVLDVNVTIVDEAYIRIGGTGPYKQKIGQIVPYGSFFRRILETGEPGIIRDEDRSEACRSCTTAGECLELATMGFPILKSGVPVGVIGIMAFTAEQKARILGSSGNLWSFLTHMSSLLESKLMLMDANRKLQYQVQEVMEAVGRSYSFGTMIGRSSAFKELIREAGQIAPGKSTVFIRGESGTGKELLARAIHSASARQSQPFIVVNCPSIPETLLESELFGYEAGAFTGANKGGRTGKFELAHQGTIFLDEIGDLPLSLQPKILRVIQERMVDRIGGKRLIPVDVRVIAATNQDIEGMVERGAFRADLYYRLNVIPLNIPPLRERKEDIELYLRLFLEQYSKSLNKPIASLDPEFIHWAKEYTWPGNVRQLQNVVEYMVNMAGPGQVGLDDLPRAFLGPGGRSTKVDLGLDEQVAEFEKTILVEYLRKGSSLEEKKRVAKVLKISLATLYRKLEKYGMN